ncbi:hypothetical protein EJB05_10695, partial [Eragrostis curvula]
MASLPLDVLLEIAARSDPVTLVRFAATCRAVRRRVADPTFWRRLRLRHSDRFVPSLLRGHLMMAYKDRSFSNVELQFVDTTTPDATARPVTADDGFLHRTDGKTSMRRQDHVASRDGLLLVWSSNNRPPYDSDLCVCDPATRRSQPLPAEPMFRNEVARTLWQPYVLLVGDGESDAAGGVGQPFQVLKTNLALSPNHRFLKIHIFSSDTGMWGPYVEIQAPDLHGSRLLKGEEKPLVVDGSVHWLCVTDKGNYVLKLQVGEAKVVVTELPATFPRPMKMYRDLEYLLVTTSPSCGSLMVLVAGRRKISAWVQEKQTGKWKEEAQDVIENDDIPREKTRHHTFDVWLHWFAERSCIVLIEMKGYGFFLLDIRSMKIVNRYETWSMYAANDHPYEMHLSSWVPTFSGTL